MDNIGIAYNADKSWPVANVTSGECYGGAGSGGMLTESQNYIKDGDGPIRAQGDVYLYG